MKECRSARGDLAADSRPQSHRRGSDRPRESALAGPGPEGVQPEEDAGFVSSTKEKLRVDVRNIPSEDPGEAWGAFLARPPEAGPGHAGAWRRVLAVGYRQATRDLAAFRGIGRATGRAAVHNSVVAGS